MILLLDYELLSSDEVIQPAGLAGADITFFAFMVAFTFGQATMHYISHKKLMLEEASEAFGREFPYLEGQKNGFWSCIDCDYNKWSMTLITHVHFSLNK
jgi:hypothetical protein